MKAFVSQLRAELRVLLRNGEQLLLTIIIPVLLLVFFSKVDVLPTGDVAESIDFLTPGVLALAIMSSAMVSVGISTGFERGYKVLKRLGITPLGRGRWITAKVVSIITVEVLQMVVIVAVALALGWNADTAKWLPAVGAVAVGTVAFGGLGLFIAGRLRAEINLAAQNGLYLVLLLLGGMVIPFDELPGGLSKVAKALPSGALADIIRDTLMGGADRPATSWMVLGAWAIVTPVLAALTFRWE